MFCRCCTIFNLLTESMWIALKSKHFEPLQMNIAMLELMKVESIFREKFNHSEAFDLMISGAGHSWFSAKLLTGVTLQSPVKCQNLLFQFKHHNLNCQWTALTTSQVVCPLSWHVDKRHFFTGSLTTNKGRRRSENTLERNFPTPMCHQRNSCFHMQI